MPLGITRSEKNSAIYKKNVMFAQEHNRKHSLFG